MTADVDVPPIGASDLDRFAAGLPPDQAALAVALVGIELGQFGAWKAVRNSWPAVSGSPVPFVEWAPTRHALAAPPSTVLGLPDATALSHRLDPHEPFDRQPPPVRLSLGGDADPLDVVPRLLACDGISSVIIPMARAAGTLRAREWNWPYRLGTMDARLARAIGATGARSASSPPMPDGLVDVVDDTTDRRSLDVLLIQTSLDEAVVRIRRQHPVAKVLVIAGEVGGPWPVVAANLAMLRAVSGAVAVAVVGPRSRAALANAVRWFVYLSSHGHAVDVALTEAFGRELLLGAETAALADAALPLQLGTRARELRADVMRAHASAPPPPTDAAVGPDPEVLAQLDELEQLEHGDFSHESAAAWRARDLGAGIEAALDAVAQKRTLQVRVHPSGQPPFPAQSLEHGPNDVDVFVGPTESGAIQGAAMTNEQLGFTATSMTVRLSAVLVPLQPPGPIVRVELDVPRTGRSEDATLPWAIPPGTRRAQARLLLIHRNRVIQTGLLSGEVGRGPVTLTERVVLWDGFAKLDDRQPFDVSLVLNHDRRGRARAVAHANGETVIIPARQELSGPTERLRQALVGASALKGSGASREEAVRKLFIEVAVEGKRLYNYIARVFDALGDPKHIQVITTRPTWFLPLELVYDHAAPDDDAALCPRWIAGEECGDHCFTAGAEHRIVCPHAFWGMSRVIERHWVDLTGAAGEDDFRVTGSPHYQRNRLRATHAVVAASKRIAAADVNRTITAFGAGTVHATSWEAWEAAVADTRLAPDLLVIMPHTDATADTMEISGKPLRGGRVDAVRHVTGGRSVRPVVVLFGCDTAGSLEDPAGWATLFMQMDAGVVFATLTMLLNRHAAELSQRLAADLLAARRTPRPLGELITGFRTEAVRQGLIAALAVTAYGDSDWRI